MISKNSAHIIGDSITVLGAGSVYIPVIIESLIPYLKDTPIKRIYLVDIDSKRLDVVAGFCIDLVKKINKSIKVYGITDIEEALPHSAIVLTMFRVGGMAARNSDELIGMKYSLGQETQGYGGFASALRGIPTLKNLITLMQKYCPEAWLLDITNPVGIMTRAALDLGAKKVIGVCELPFSMRKAIAAVTDSDIFTPEVSYAGLNHLGWIYEVKLHGKDITDNLISNNIHEIINKACPNNIRNLLIKCNLVDKVFDYEIDKFSPGTIFSPYLVFYYYFNEITRFQRTISWTRVKTLKKVNNSLLEEYKHRNIEGRWRDILKERGGFLLGETIGPLIQDMLQKNAARTHIVCTRNNGTIPFLPDDAVVEVPSRISWKKVIPLSQENPLSGDKRKDIRLLMERVSSYEALTAKAAEVGSYDIALQALSSHPLINSKSIAKKLLDTTLVKYKDYLHQFNHEKT